MQSFPLAFCLMQDKKKSSYTAIFKFIRDEYKFNITDAMVDFELGLKNALLETYPDAKLRGCWFHFAQALVRQLHKMPSKIRYRPDIKDQIRKLIALPLLPDDKIKEAYHLIKNEIISRPLNNAREHFKDFFVYFENRANKFYCFWHHQTHK